MRKFLCFILILIIFAPTIAYAGYYMSIKEYPVDNKYFNGSYVLVDIILSDIKELKTYCGPGTI